LKNPFNPQSYIRGVTLRVKPAYSQYT
jgi:hypothetical protein